jgi:hypothetical protein
MTTMLRCGAIIGTIVAVTSIHIASTNTTVTAAAMVGCGTISVGSGGNDNDMFPN